MTMQSTRDPSSCLQWHKRARTAAFLWIKIRWNHSNVTNLMFFLLPSNNIIYMKYDFQKWFLFLSSASLFTLFFKKLYFIVIFSYIYLYLKRRIMEKKHTHTLTLALASPSSFILCNQLRQMFLLSRRQPRARQQTIWATMKCITD